MVPKHLQFTSKFIVKHFVLLIDLVHHAKLGTLKNGQYLLISVIRF